jgi:hypothetical protein
MVVKIKYFSGSEVIFKELDGWWLILGGKGGTRLSLCCCVKQTFSGLSDG